MSGHQLDSEWNVNSLLYMVDYNYRNCGLAHGHHQSLGAYRKWLKLGLIGFQGS
jgi:hypothetical protein